MYEVRPLSCIVFRVNPKGVVFFFAKKKKRKKIPQAARPISIVSSINSDGALGVTCYCRLVSSWLHNAKFNKTVTTMNLFFYKSPWALNNILSARNRVVNISPLREFSVAKSLPSKLHSWYVTGFTDAEGTFVLVLTPSKSGYLVKMFFEIGLDKRDLALLESIQSYFGVGNIYVKGERMVKFTVQSLEGLQVIINHFYSYPLLTNKWIDYQLFKMAFEIKKNKEHLTTEGLNKLIAIKASMNRGLSPSLKTAFNGIAPLERPQLKSTLVKDPNWIIGFVDGEGCFFVRVQENKNSSKKYVTLKFQLVQHIRDLNLIKSLEEYFGCGRVETRKDLAYYVVTVASDVFYKIVPFFNNYPLQGVKQENFEDFSKIVSLIKNKEHLTESGLDKIKQIKSRMNKQRVYSDSSSEESSR